MTTTDHAQEAAGALIKSREWLECEEFARADLAVKRAQAHATLAVAHELKTANLIAVMERAAHTIDVTAWPTSRVDRFNAAQHEIATRLGLDGGAE